MDQPIYIYTLSEPNTGRVRYVGKTNDMKQRFSDHYSESVAKRSNKRDKWVKSLKAKGLFPIMEVLETVAEDEWEDAEKFWIQNLKFLGCDLLNSNGGGHGGISPSPEVRQKIGAARVGWKHSPETKARIAASCKARMTDEEKERLRIKCSGWHQSNATKKAISDAKKGKPRSEEVRLKLLAGSLKWKLENGWTMKKPDGKFAAEIVAWRKARGLQQKQAAAVLGYSLGAYAAWEYAKREPKPVSLPEIRRRMEAVPKP